MPSPNLSTTLPSNSMAAGGTGAARGEDEWLRVYGRVVAMLPQVEALAAARARLEAVNALQHEFWEARDALLQHRLLQAEESVRRWEAAYIDLQPSGDDQRFAELQQSDLEDLATFKDVFAAENTEFQIKVKEVDAGADHSQNPADHERITEDLKAELRKLKQAYEALCSEKDKKVSEITAERDFVRDQFKTLERDYADLRSYMNNKSTRASEAALELQKNVEQLQVASQKKDEEIQKKRSAPEPAALQAPIKAGLRTKSRCVKRARKEPQASSTSQETNDTSSGEIEEVLMPTATLDLAPSKSVADKAANLAKPTAETQEPIISSSAVPLVLGEGCDLSSLLTFDPESIEPATSRVSEELGPSTTNGQLQRLKALLSSSIEALVENPEEVKGILEDIQPHLPVTLQVKLWPVVTLSAFRSRVKLARQRIDLRHAQLPLKADIANKCQRLNEKKAALDAKTDTSVSSTELETLRKELEDLEERVRVTKQLIQDKEALIAHSQEEAEGLKVELKTDLAEIRALNRQLVTGKDEDDETEIAEVDRVRADALHALEAFLQ